MNDLLEKDVMGPKMSEELSKHYMKNQMDVNKAVAKEYFLNDARMQFAERKLLLQECWREARRASYVEIIIGKDGGVVMETKNAVVKLPKRKVVNFKISKFCALQSSEGEAGIYGLELEIGGRKEWIFLNSKDIGKEDYFKRKIMAVGGTIYANTKKEQRLLLEGLWVELCSRCMELNTIPTEQGWFRNEKGEYRFAEDGELLWEEIKELAK